MFKIVRGVLLVCVILLISLSSADAARRSFGIDPYTVYTINGAYHNFAGGVSLPDQQSYANNMDPWFVIRFILPEAYKNNTPVNIHLYYVPMTAMSIARFAKR